MKEIKLSTLIDEVYDMNLTLEELEGILKNPESITDPIEKIKLKLWYDSTIYRRLYGVGDDITPDLMKMMKYLMDINKVSSGILPLYLKEQEPTMKLKSSEIKDDPKWLGILLRFMIMWKWCTNGMDDNYQMYLQPIIQEKISETYKEIENALHNNQLIREYNELIMSHIQHLVSTKEGIDRTYLLENIQQYYIGKIDLF